MFMYLSGLLEGPRPLSVGLFASGNSPIPSTVTRILREPCPSPWTLENASSGPSLPIFRPLFSEKFGKLLAAGPRSSHLQSSRYACVAESG